jgi:hypothetical protein
MYGTAGRVRDDDRKSADRLLEEVWDNSGNLVFQRAASLLVDDPKLFVGRGADVDGDQSRVVPDCKAIVFPAANHIDAGRDLGSLADWLGYAGLPVVVWGIGTQAPDTSDAALDHLTRTLANDGGFRRLATVFRRPDVFVGVRGEFTRRLLERFDVPAVVTGCPSFLMNAQIDLGRQLQERWARLRVWSRSGSPGLRLAVTAASPWGRREMSAEQTLLRWLCHFGGIYVQQSGGVDVYRAMLDQFDGDAQREAVLQRLAPRYGAWGERQSFRRLMTDHGRLFFDVESWQDAIAACDLSIGTRYHGNALAMQMSVPALVAVHDSRTDELCRSTMIPIVPVEAIGPTTQLRHLLEVVRFDGAAYDARRHVCATQVCEALRRAGISPAPRLRKLAAATTLKAVAAA